MSTNISSNLLLNFIKKTIGSDSMDKNKAQHLTGMSDAQFGDYDDNGDKYIDIDEIVADEDLYEQFATMFVDEQKKDKAADEEKEKEKANKVQTKGQNKA